MDDKKIIKLYVARDERAVSETEKKYRPYCFTISYNILGNKESADECLNDTWLETWLVIPPEKPKVLRLFLAKITRNISLDRYRKNHAQKRGGGQLPLILDELSEVIPSGFDLEEELCYRVLVRKLNRFVSELLDEDREIFLQRYFYAVPAEELAAQQNSSANAVSVRLSRLRRDLKTALESEDVHEKHR